MQNTHQNQQASHNEQSRRNEFINHFVITNIRNPNSNTTENVFNNNLTFQNPNVSIPLSRNNNQTNTLSSNANIYISSNIDNNHSNIASNIASYFSSNASINNASINNASINNASNVSGYGNIYGLSFGEFQNCCAVYASSARAASSVLW